MENKQQHNDLEIILILVLASIFLYWRLEMPWILGLGAIVGLAGVFIPWLRNAIAWSWRRIGTALGFITNRIILAVVFMFVLVPTSWASKRIRRQDKGKSSGTISNYVDRNHEYAAADMENPW